MSAAAFAEVGAATVDGRGEELSRIFHSGDLTGLGAVSDIAGCLMPLLAAVGWRGNPRHIAEALPHFKESMGIEDLRAVLANLRYSSHALHLRLARLDARLLPCLFVPEDGPAMVLYGREGARFLAYNGATAAHEPIDGRAAVGLVYVVTPLDKPEAPAGAPRDAWFASTARRFRGLVIEMLAITSVTSLLALAVPLFIMAVYDQVIATGSAATLFYLVLGIGLAIAADVALRALRARSLAYVAGRIDLIVGEATFARVLRLPIAMTERAAMGAQLARLKQFESVREFFTGPLAAVFLELPFVVLFVAVIALLAGPMAWIPVILIGIFALLGALVIPRLGAAVKAAGDTRLRRQEFLVEMLSNLRTIKYCAGEAVWSGRFREMQAACAAAGFRTSQIAVLVRTAAQGLMLAAGIATLALGTLQALDGDLSVGALIASMALVWRVLTPLQVAFLSLTRLEQVKLGLRQINALMSLTPEYDTSRIVERHRRFKGEVSFDRVSLRYGPNAEPALLAVGFRVRPGEIVAITGSNGSGKSTVLNLIAGLHKAQAGAVMIDGIDIRQLDTEELRAGLACVPQTCHLFHGTIEQNLRLANPLASDADLSCALLEADLLDDILRLPEGLATRLTDQLQRQLPAGFKQRLSLARAYVRDAPIYLLDEPGYALDEAGDAALVRKLQQLRGQATVIMVTHRPSHMRLADRLIILDRGQVTLSGAPEDVLAKLERT